MKKFTIASALLFLTICSTAQNLAWSKQFGGTTNDVGKAVTKDAAGNVYTTGFFTGTADFNPAGGGYTLAAVGGQDIFVTKFGPTGTFIWAVQMGGAGNDNGNAVAVDASGNVYTTGFFQSTAADFDPGAGTFTLSSLSGSQDIFISKLNALGSFVWVKQMAGTSDESANAIAVDGNGVYTTGAFIGTTNFNPVGGFSLTSGASLQDIFVSKLDLTGNFVWAKQFGSTSFPDFGFGIALDPTGNVYTTGYFQNTVDFDPGVGSFTIASLGSLDIYISKLDVAGSFVWAKAMGGISFDIGQAITVDANSNVYTTGYFNGTSNFDPAGTATLVSAGGNDVFVSKLNASGTYVSAVRMGGPSSDLGTGIGVDALGNIYTVGYFNSVGADFDPGVTTFTMSTAGSNDIFISKLDATSSFLWAEQIGSTGDDRCNAGVYAGAYNDVYLTGYFNLSPDFDPTVATFSMTSLGGQDAFLTKLAPVCVTPAAPTNTTPTGNLTICEAKTATLSATSSVSVIWYPTPTSTTAIGSGSNFISPTLTAGTYTYFAEASGCTVSASRTAITITVNALPTVSVTGGGTICVGVQSATLTASGANTYSWSTNSTSASIVVSPTTTATYTAIGTNSTTGCSNTFTVAVVVDLCTGIQSQKIVNADVKVYPNPTSGEFVISLNSLAEKTNIRIYNSLGELILKQTITSVETKIDLKEFSDGIYMIKVLLNDKTVSHLKVIKY